MQNKTYWQKLLALDKNDPTYEVRKECYKKKMKEDLDAVDTFEQKFKKGKGKRRLQDID